MALNKQWSTCSTLLKWSATSRRLKSYDACLKTVLKEMIPHERNRIREMKETYGKTKIGDITVGMLYDGMRDMKALICETSLLDSEEGIRFRGLTVGDCLRLLPTVPGGAQPLPEGMFWLLMTGDVPTSTQAKQISDEWGERAKLPPYMHKFLKNIPPEVHPMRQLSSALAVLSDESVFGREYQRGAPKSAYWESVYEDSMNLIARLPTVAASIYNNVFKNGKIVEPYVEGDDWSRNFARMLGFDDSQFAELLRLYLTIHCDHEGGNVSSHAAHLCGSALSDAYLCMASGVNGLAGPLHGSANQEVMHWLEALQAEIGADPSEEDLREYVAKVFREGRLVPGYGHAVLRKTDPRFSCQWNFARVHLPDDPWFRLAVKLYEIVPEILMESGKVKNPWPNVDALSGVLLQHYGLRERSYYTVPFAVSRSLGVLSQLVWSRALGFPIERPKSVSTDALSKIVQK